MKRKRKTALPRVTVLAFNRKDLLAFVEAVEQLRLHVADLAQVVKDLQGASKGRKARPAATGSTTAGKLWGAEVPTAPQGGEVKKP